MNFQEQKDFYNELWRNENFINRLKLARCVGVLQAIQSTNLIKPFMVELGCGTGWLTGILANIGPTIGVELSDEAIKKAKEVYPNAFFISANIFEWKYEPASFDIVVSHEVIEHVEEQAKYLQIAADLLKPGGYLILTTPNLITFEAMPEEQRKAWSNQPIEKLVDFSELKILLSKNFKIIESSTLIHGYGSKGIYRIMNSKKIKTVFYSLRLGWLFEKLRASQGLHLLVLAQKL